jgi:hypothetical protein
MCLKSLTLRRAFERNRGYQEEVFEIHVPRWDKFFFRILFLILVFCNGQYKQKLKASTSLIMPLNSLKIFQNVLH